MTIYRQRLGRDTWHFELTCHWWPKILGRGKAGYRQREAKPKSGEMCNECRAIRRRTQRRAKR